MFHKQSICCVCNTEIKGKDHKLKFGSLCKDCYKTLDSAVLEEMSAAKKLLGMSRERDMNRLTVNEAREKIDAYRKAHPGFWAVLQETMDEAVERAGKEAMDKKLSVDNTNKEYREIKVTCSVCGHIHFYDYKDMLDNSMHAMGSVTFGGALEAVERSQIKDLDRCPSCGSRAVKIEEVINTVS